MSTFKILMVGDAGVGKTTFIRKHITGEFEKKYNATNVIDVRCLNFNTNKGNITFTICDMGGQDKLNDTKKYYAKGCDGAVIVFDVTSKVSYNNILEHYNFASQYCKDDSIVLCGNKVDCKDRKVKPSDITFHREHNLQYYDISAKSNYNFEKPFLYLIRKFLGADTNFVESSALLPPEVSISLKNLEVEVKNQAQRAILTLDDKLKIFVDNCSENISLKIALQIIKDDKLWETWYQMYKMLDSTQIILPFKDENEIKFYIASK